MESIPLFWLRKEQLEKVLLPEKELVVELVDVIKRSFRKLINALDPEKYPKARTYIINFKENSLVFFDCWLEGKGWIPITTNAVETAFSRVVNRVKRIGMDWSKEGLLNWLMIAFRKMLVPSLWEKLWEDYLSINKQLTLSSLKVEYAWI